MTKNTALSIQTVEEKPQNDNKMEEIIVINLNPLEQFEIEEYEKEPEEVRKRFKIEDLNSANWAMRKIRAYKMQQEEVDALAKAETERIKTWQEKEKKKTENQVEFFESLLTEFLYDQRKSDEKYKISTPYGTVSTRKNQDKWNLKDEPLLAWLKENDRTDLIRTKEEPALRDIKTAFIAVGVNAVDENGEIIPGIYIQDQPESVIIKIND